MDWPMYLGRSFNSSFAMAINSSACPSPTLASKSSTFVFVRIDADKIWSKRAKLQQPIKHAHRLQSPTTPDELSHLVLNAAGKKHDLVFPWQHQESRCINQLKLLCIRVRLPTQWSQCCFWHTQKAIWFQHLLTQMHPSFCSTQRQSEGSQA